MGISFLFSFAFSFSSFLSYLWDLFRQPFCISSSWGRFWSLPPTLYYEPLSIVLQALCLPDLIPWIYSLPQLYNHKGYNLCHTWIWPRDFPYFLQFKPEFCNKELMIWATVSSRSCFYWLCRASPSSVTKNIIIWFQYWPSGDVHV